MNHAARHELCHISEPAGDLKRKIERREYGAAEPGGLLTGIRELDLRLRGFQAGQLIVLGAHPMMGRSSLAMQIVCHVSVACGVAGYYVQFEMSGREIVERMGAMIAGMPLTAIRNYERMDGEQQMTIQTALRQIEVAPIWTATETLHTLETLRESILRLKFSVPELALVTIDCMQAIRVEGNMERAEVQDRLADGLKALAREAEVVVLAVSQLKTHARGRRRGQRRMPCFGKLRDFDGILSCADVVLFLKREPAQGRQRTEPDEAILRIAKNRHGEIGDVHLLFRHGAFLSR